MKKILTLTLCLLTMAAKSQHASIEHSTYGIQTGLLGFWVHKESKLSNQLALRSEIGLDAEIWGGSFYDGVGFLLAPVITLEPRWYYNLQKRASKSKEFRGNSGNFISLKMSHHPNWFLISNNDNIRIVSDISIIPTWGIRRNMGDRLTYEAGIGIGYVYYFAKNAGYLENEGDAILNLHLRIGYRFK